MANRYIEANGLVRILEREEEYLANEGLEQRANGIRDAIMDVLSAPSADVRENVRGKWEDRYDGTVCQKCGKYVYDDGDYHIIWHPNFCPNCGADMRGEEYEDISEGTL